MFRFVLSSGCAPRVVLRAGVPAESAAAAQAVGGQAAGRAEAQAEEEPGPPYQEQFVQVRRRQRLRREGRQRQGGQTAAATTTTATTAAATTGLYSGRASAHQQTATIPKRNDRELLAGQKTCNFTDAEGTNC